jgi:cobalt-zinc-cadmium efflux system outer membrane protein
VCAVVLCVGISCHAQGASTTPTVSSTLQSTSEQTLEQLAAQLLANNAQLRSAAGLGAAAQFGVEPARTLDNPTFGITQDPMRHNPFAVGTSTSMSWSLTQNLPWPGKKQLSGEIAQSQANFTKEQTELLKVQLLGQLKTTWSNWQQTQAQMSMTQIQAERLEQVKEIVKLRYANNASAYADYINAQVALAQMQSDLLGLKRQSQSLLAQIGVLIGLEPSHALRIKVESAQVDTRVLTLDQFKQKAQELHPAIKASRHSLEAAQHNVALAELGKRPDFSVSMIAHPTYAPWGTGGNDAYGLNVAATFPLYYASKERNLIDQAKAQLGAARDADESVQQQVALAVETAYLQWLQSLQQFKLLEERVLAQAKIAYRMALGNYSNNQATYMDVLNAYNALKGAEFSIEQARSTALQARIGLDVAVGESK